MLENVVGLVIAAGLGRVGLGVCSEDVLEKGIFDRKIRNRRNEK